MDSITDLLQKSTPQEPPQIAALKNYIKDNYQETAHVRVSRDAYIMTVPSGSLASRLQMDLTDIMALCELDKPLRIHIMHK